MSAAADFGSWAEGAAALATFGFTVWQSRRPPSTRDERRRQAEVRRLTAERNRFARRLAHTQRALAAAKGQPASDATWRELTGVHTTTRGWAVPAASTPPSSPQETA